MSLASPPEPALALGALAECCDGAVEALLGALPVAGDRATQQVLDGYLDAVMDALRMLAAGARDVAATLPTTASTASAPAGAPGDRASAPAGRSALRPEGPGAGAVDVGAGAADVSRGPAYPGGGWS